MAEVCRNIGIVFLISMLASSNVAAVDEAANLQCQNAIDSDKDVYRKCWGYDQNVISLSQILERKETIKLVNDVNVSGRVNHIRALFISILPRYVNSKSPIDLSALQFAVDLYHTLPSGKAPPPSDITPTVVDKGLLWRFDEPIGGWSMMCGPGIRSKGAKEVIRLCDYFFNRNNIDTFEKKARYKQAIFPSPREADLIRFMEEGE